MRDDSQGAVFNRHAFMSRVMDDAGLAGMVIAAFLEDIPGQIQALRKAIEEADPVMAGRTSHAIKGASANLGGEVVQAVAAKMELAGEKSDLAGLQATLPALEQHLAEFQEAIKDFVAGR